MEPIVSSITETDEALRFELSNVDVSVVNSLRRVILTNIDQLVFRGFPHADNQLNFEKNNTKFNNEFLKHRIQNVPIYESDVTKYDNFVKNYCVKVKVSNDTNTRKDVTTKDFKIVQKDTGKEIGEAETRKIFPADKITQDYILLAVLMPKVSETDEPEELNLTLQFSIGNAKQDSCWNVVSKCAYYNKPDDPKIKKAIADKPKEEKRDFELLDAQRLFVPNQFNFHLTSVGVFSNQEILQKACSFLIERMTEFSRFLERATFTNVQYGEMEPFGLYQSETGFYLRIEEDDYTIGKLIENHLNLMYSKDIYYISFKKDHPHDSHCFVSFQYKNPVELETITQHLSQVSKKIIDSYKSISTYFMN
jgi:DNA-directed RNA polymerase subunit L